MTGAKLTAGVWAAIAGAAVPVVITMVSLFSRNVTMLSEHEVRITNIENGQVLLVDEYLKASVARRDIAERVAHLEGRMQSTPEIPIPGFSSDRRGYR